MNNTVLGFALKILLEELGCTVIDINDIAIVKHGSIQLKLEKRDDYWHDLEKNLKFYSRSQIAIYMLGDQSY